MLFAILGYLLIALPFIGIFIFAWKKLGWQDTLFAFGFTAIIIAIISIGVYFLGLAGIVQVG